MFDEILSFVEQSGLYEVQVTVQTPFPGTSLYERLHLEGRLFADRFWEKCTLFDMTHEPRGMSTTELRSGLIRNLSERCTTTTRSAVAGNRFMSNSEIIVSTDTPRIGSSDSARLVGRHTHEHLARSQSERVLSDNSDVDLHANGSVYLDAG